MPTTKLPAFKTRVYRLWTYDVWGNARDGYEVNDRRDCGTVTIRCKRETHNAGTSSEFHTWNPTDRQLSRAVGGRDLVWDGESDYTLHAETGRGRPVCELEFEAFAGE